MLAIAVANGTIRLLRWKDSAQLSEFEEFRSIDIVTSHGECICLSWNPAEDEPMSLAVGCQITTAKESYPVKENLNLQADLL